MQATARPGQERPSADRGATSSPFTGSATRVEPGGRLPRPSRCHGKRWSVPTPPPWAKTPAENVIGRAPGAPRRRGHGQPFRWARHNHEVLRQGQRLLDGRSRGVRPIGHLAGLQGSGACFTKVLKFSKPALLLRDHKPWQGRELVERLNGRGGRIGEETRLDIEYAVQGLAPFKGQERDEAVSRPSPSDRHRGASIDQRCGGHQNVEVAEDRDAMDAEPDLPDRPSLNDLRRHYSTFFFVLISTLGSEAM